MNRTKSLKNTVRIQSILNRIIYNEDELIRFIIQNISSRKKFGITYINQHSINQSVRNDEYYASIENMNLFMDGVGVNMMMKIFKYQPDLFNATDMYDKLFKKIINQPNNMKVVIIGGNMDRDVIINLSKEKKIEILNYINGFEEHDKIMDIISVYNHSNYLLIGIGMGTPHQEILASRILNELDNCGVLCLGKFWEYYFNYAKRPPRITTKMGLEWFFRMLYEPKLYWKRYLLGIPLFLYYLVYLKIIQHK